MVTVTRSDIDLVDRYVRSREQQARDARPAMNYIDQAARDEAAALKQRLRSIAPGREQAAEYQRLVLEILNFLFSPELIDGQRKSGLSTAPRGVTSSSPTIRTNRFGSTSDQSTPEYW